MPHRTALMSTPGLRRPGRWHAVLLALVLASTAALAALQPTVASAGTRQSSETFRVATFNVLGASHTDKRRRGFDTYRPRMRRTVRLLEERGLDIVGFQEYQWRQHKMFRKLTAGSWQVYPGLTMGRRPVQNSIVWRSSEWEPVEKRVYKIPYFYGKLVKQPYVLLRHRHSGVQVWVINTHNPADARGPAQHWRDQAVRIQIDLANRLEATGRPVFLVGDFNDREEAYCPITAATGLQSSAPGGGWLDGRCRVPRYTRIDWVFLSRQVDVVEHVMLDNAKTDAITDHPVVYAEVTAPLR